MNMLLIFQRSSSILNEIVNFYLNILNKLSETTNLARYRVFSDVNLNSVDNDLNELSERFKQLIYRTNIMRQAEVCSPTTILCVNRVEK